MAAAAAAASSGAPHVTAKAKWERMTDAQLQRTWQLFWRKQLGKADVERLVFFILFLITTNERLTHFVFADGSNKVSRGVNTQEAHLGYCRSK